MPGRAAEQWNVSANAVVKVLPAFDQSGADVKPLMVRGRFHEQQHTAGCHQLAHVADGRRQMLRGVQRVRRSDDVERCARNALLGSAAVSIEHRGAQRHTPVESCMGAIEE